MIAAVDALWCGERNGRCVTSGCSGDSTPATEWIRITSSASRGSSGGRIDGSRRPSIVLPVPGGPASRRLWPPVAASSSARRARSWPAHVGEVRRIGLGGDVGRLRRRRPQLAAKVGDRLGQVPHRDRLDAAELRLAGRLWSTEDSLESSPSRSFRDRERAANGPHPPVERQFADGGMLGKPLGRYLP